MLGLISECKFQAAWFSSNVKVKHTIAFQHGKFILLRCYGCKHIILHCKLNSKEFAKSDFAMKENVHLSTSNEASSSQASTK